MEVALTDNLSSTFSGAYSHNDDNTQWLGNFRDAANHVHYAFAHLNQRTLSASLRLNVTVNPTLSVQAYAQPFVSTGSNSNIRQLSGAPSAAGYDARFVAYRPPVGTATDFVDRQFNASSVVRWEYRPGSTLFLVWTQGRQQFDSFTDAATASAAPHDPGRIRPDNTVLLKFSYWFDR